MSLQLREALHWCDCGGRAVFLDTRADRYFCLSTEANEAFLRIAADKMHAEDTERVEMLLERGLLIEGGASASIQPAPLIEPPASDVVDASLARTGALSVLRAIASELGAARALRTKPFQDVIEAVRRCRPSDPEDSPQCGRSVRKIASAAHLAALVTRSHDRCLVRALAVHSMCTRRGVPTKLVFGVVAHPFTAHCWVQLGSSVLVGGYEQARLYTPILVLP